MMAHLLFKGVVDFTVSEIDNEGLIEFVMQDHEVDQTQTYAEMKLSVPELTHLRNWIDRQLDSHENGNQG